VLAALAVGDQSSIDRADWDLFRTTGVGHLMSISGLHVTMWAWVAAAVVGALWRRSARASQWLPAPVAARWGGLLLAAGYALLAGWGVPAQRTVWMLAVVTLMRTGGRHWPAHTVLLTAAAVVVLLDPWALLQVGFWLSFVAVGLLMLGAPGSGTVVAGMPEEPGRLRRALARAGRAVAAALRTQLVASLGLAPLTLLLFHELSVVGFAANLVAIPWVTAVVTPLALLSAVLPPVQPLAEAAVRALMALLAPMASWPGATWSVAAAPAGVGLLALAGGALAVAPLPGRLRLAGLLMVVPLLTHRADAPPWGEVRVVAFDVGQGTAVAMQTQRHRLLYDTGPRPAGAAAASAPDAAHRVLLPWWRAQGRPVIDRLVLSHRDTDHTGGAATLLAQVPVRSSLSSLEDGHALRDRLPAHQSCAAGASWVWDGVRFEVLHPALGDDARGLKPNALSCVLRVVDRHGPRLLLTGDIEAAQEAELLARHADDPGTLRARHLLLPHHGSQTSSSPGLLDAVQPATAIAQAAYRNRFGHPSAEVVQRLAGRGITLHRSDRCGAWQWPSAPVTGRSRAPSDDNGICQREHARRYWHHPGQP
jgi:competence protein ComEC